MRGFGVLGEDVCRACRGRFLPEDVVERVIVEELGVTRAMLRELMALFASKERIACPACASKMSPLHLQSVRIDVCSGCGGVWLDAGELSRLSRGRYEELVPSESAAPTAPTARSPTPVFAPTSRPGDAAGAQEGRQAGDVVISVVTDSASGLTPGARAGDARFVVFVDTLGPLDKDALTAAFARCPGLTEADAVALARHNNGVVVDGVGEETARRIAEALVDNGVGARVADDAWTLLPNPAHAQVLAPRAAGLFVGQDIDGLPPIPWHAVAAASAGVARRGSLKQTGTLREGRDVEMALVEADEAFFDVVYVDDGALLRRVRHQLSTALFGDENRGRDRMLCFQERVAACARLMPPSAGRGRGVLSSVAGDALPRYRSLRDLEREESWLLWRARAPGA